MLTSRQKQMLQEIPKAENHIHIEGSIPWALALELAEKNHVKLPVHSTEEIAVWSQDLISRKGLDGFMICDRTLNSVCLHEEDYEAVVLALAKEDQRQNIIYQELHLDYPLNEERGIPLKVVMEGYRSAQKKAKKLYGVEIVYIAGLDMDFKGNPFGPMPQLCAIADEVSKVHAICVKCGQLASFSHRTVKNDKQVLLGETAEYEPLCRECYLRALEEDGQKI